jgi:hypothetical protein
LEESGCGGVTDFAAGIGKSGLEPGFVRGGERFQGKLDEKETEGCFFGFPGGLDGSEGFLRIAFSNVAEPLEAFLRRAGFPIIFAAWGGNREPIPGGVELGKLGATGADESGELGPEGAVVLAVVEEGRDEGVGRTKITGESVMKEFGQALCGVSR